MNYITSIGGIEIKYNQELGKNITLEELNRDYDAVYLGIGVGVARKLDIPGEEMEGVVDAINNTALGLIARGGDIVTAAVQHVVGWIIYLPWLVLIPVLSFFLLKDADSFRRSALAMLPRGRLRWRGDEFFQDVNSTLASYIRAQLTACFLVGVMCSVGFALIGLPSPLVLGLMAGMLEDNPA